MFTRLWMTPLSEEWKSQSQIDQQQALIHLAGSLEYLLE